MIALIDFGAERRREAERRRLVRRRRSARRYVRGTAEIIEKLAEAEGVDQPMVASLARQIISDLDELERRA